MMPMPRKLTFSDTINSLLPPPKQNQLPVGLIRKPKDSIVME
jgi:hypothetical protein